MSEWLKLFFSLSFSGSLLIILLFALRPMYRRRLGKAWQYYIWLIVIARLLIPVTPEASVSTSVFQYFEDKAESVSFPFEDISSEEDLSAEVSGQGNMGNAISGQKIQESDSYPSFFHMTWLLWFVVPLLLLIRKITLYQSFTRFIKAGRREISDLALLNLLGEVMEEANLKAPIGFYVNPLASSPMLIGFFHPCIILPTIELPIKQLRFIIKHELVHYKRLDLFYKWLTHIVLCIHWFNPFVYFMAAEINRNCELSCDEAIINSLAPSERAGYGDTLLASLRTTGLYTGSLASITMSEGVKQIKERLGAIMDYKKKTVLNMTATLLLTLLLSISFLVTGAYGGNSHWDVMTSGGDGETIHFTQSSFYQEPYIFELGWNLNKAGYDYYSDKAKITCADKTQITVSFDPSCKTYAANQDALSKLTVLIDTQNTNRNPFPIEKPFVIQVKKIDPSRLDQLAEEYYTASHMNDFTAIYSSLSSDLQKLYCDKIFEDGRIAYFSIILNDLDENRIRDCAEKAYRENKLNFFSVLSSHLTEEERQVWIERSMRDKRNTFLAVLM